MSKWQGLLTSRKVWLALLGLVIAVVNWAGVEIPVDVFVAVEVLIVAVIAGIAVEDHGLRSNGR